jgi:serine/threonine protein phosphatase PrpC
MLPITIEEKMGEETDETKLDMKKVLKDAYETVHRDIALGEVTDADFSGSTLCSVVMKGRTLYASNVGDSRVIMITAQKEVYQLTKDQKPDDPEEMARILNCGGRVKPLCSQINGKHIGPNRVWLAD